MAHGRAQGRKNRPLGPVHKGSAQNGSICEAKPLSVPEFTPRTILEWPQSSRDSGWSFGHSSVQRAVCCAMCGYKVGQSRRGTPPTGASSL